MARLLSFVLWLATPASLVAFETVRHDATVNLDDALEEGQLEDVEDSLATMSDVTLLQVGLTHVKAPGRTTNVLEESSDNVASVALSSAADVKEIYNNITRSSYAFLQMGSRRGNRSSSNLTLEDFKAEVAVEGMSDFDQTMAEIVGPVVASALNSSLDALEPLAVTFAQQCNDAKMELVRTVNETAANERLSAFDTGVLEELQVVVSALWIFAAGVDLAIMALSGILDTAGQDDLSSKMGSFKDSAHDNFASFVSSVDSAKILIADFDPLGFDTENSTISLVNTTLAGGIDHLDSWVQDFEQMFLEIGAGVINAFEGSDLNAEELFQFVRHRASGTASLVPAAAREGFNGIHEAAVIVSV